MSTIKTACLYSLVLLSSFAWSQPEGNPNYAVQVSYFYGNILPHSKSIQHLITEHPEGLLLSFNKRTYGDQEWESAFNYPDYGLSLHVEQTHNQTLGDLYGVFAHYNFYFLNRNLVFRIAQGVAYNTNPYHKTENFRNVAYGSHFMPSTYFLLNYNRDNIFKRIGVHGGLSFFHHSNATLKSPNTSTNTLAINLGLNYAIDADLDNVYIPRQPDTINYKKLPISYHLALRGGVNESDIIGSGQFPFFALSFNAQKRLNRKSALQLGTDLFWHEYLREYIKFKSVAYPNENISANTDFRRIGVFAGHELIINRFSAETQLGYYVYSPFKYLGPLYQRVGMKYAVTDHLSALLSLKTHGAKAEAMEVGVGIKL